MRHEKIIKREDGSQVSIEVSFTSDYFRRTFDYDVEVRTRENGKRKWVEVSYPYQQQWRAANLPTRAKMKMEEYLKHVTTEEIHQAKLELWEKLKP
jgi:hypothetical protein